MTDLVAKSPKVREHVIYFDSFGMEHDALCTANFGCYEKTNEDGTKELVYTDNPSINVLLVSPDKRREDSYGRQVERHTSVCPWVYASAWGNFYCHPDDLEEARKKCNEAKEADFVQIDE
jgi:hypothetical protein